MSVFSKIRVLTPLLASSCRPLFSRTFKNAAFNGNSFTKKAFVATICGVGVGSAVISANDVDFTPYIPKEFPGRASVYAKAADELTTAKGKAVKTTNPCGGAPCPAPDNCYYQNNITAPPTMYSLFLWISLDEKANPKCVAEIAANMDSLVDSVTSPCDGENEEVIAGVGFGPNYYNQIMGKTWRNFYYTARSGKNGDLPATPGDIFLHCKCNNLGKLFDVCKNYICSFPEGAISEFEDIYGFDFRGGRDLSGFYDCRTNRCEEAHRRGLAIEVETGGSYALTQKWIHDFCIIRPENKAQLEKYIGREMDRGGELAHKSNSSHISRMKGGPELDKTPLYEIVRHSQNFGTLATDAGQFFLAFTNNPGAFEWMLDRMVGAGFDDSCDDAMKISHCVKGAYWYFPSIDQLQCIINSGCG